MSERTWKCRVGFHDWFYENPYANRYPWSRLRMCTRCTATQREGKIGIFSHFWETCFRSVPTEEIEDARAELMKTYEEVLAEIERLRVQDSTLKEPTSKSQPKRRTEEA